MTISVQGPSDLLGIDYEGPKKKLAEQGKLEYSFLPLKDHVIIKQASPRVLVTKKGIHLPQTSERRPEEGYIIVAGSDVDQEQLRPGVRVAYSKFAGSEVEIDEVKYLIMSERDLLTIIIEKEKTDADSNSNV